MSEYRVNEELVPAHGIRNVAWLGEEGTPQRGPPRAGGVQRVTRKVSIALVRCGGGTVGPGIQDVVRVAS